MSTRFLTKCLRIVLRFSVRSSFSHVSVHIVRACPAFRHGTLHAGCCEAFAAEPLATAHCVQDVRHDKMSPGMLTHFLPNSNQGGIGFAILGRVVRELSVRPERIVCKLFHKYPVLGGWICCCSF